LRGARHECVGVVSMGRVGGEGSGGAAAAKLAREAGLRGVALFTRLRRAAAGGALAPAVDVGGSEAFCGAGASSGGGRRRCARVRGGEGGRGGVGGAVGLQRDDRRRDGWVARRGAAVRGAGGVVVVWRSCRHAVLYVHVGMGYVSELGRHQCAGCRGMAAGLQDANAGRLAGR
jgi:hypothetical protein